MLEPTGPLPPEVYWRRRMVAIGGLVAALVLVVWLIASAVGGGGGPKHQAAPAALPASTTDTADAADSSTSVTPTTPTVVPNSNSAPIVAVVPPGQCPDQSLAIKASVNQPTYRVGQQPVFQVVITNISTQACSRDLSSSQQMQVYTADGQTRIWSNTDCYPPGAPDMQNLTPGQQAAFKVNWAGATSQPGCQSVRIPVQPGSYVVIAQLGGLRSAPEPFNIVAAG